GAGVGATGAIEATAIRSDEAGRSSGESAGSGPSWTRLGVPALVQIARVETPAVAAVVLSQLQPKVAVEVLTHLPEPVGNELLRRMAHLQDIAPEAMAAI